MFNRTCGAAVTALALLASIAPVQAQGRAPLPSLEAALPPLDAVVAQFSHVAFGHEHGASRDIVQKWSVRPLIAFFTRPQFDVGPHVGRIRGLLADIHELTGLSRATSTEETPVTLRFGFYPRSDFAKLPLGAPTAESRRFFSESACIAVAVNEPGHPGDIATGAIVIGTDISERLRRHCIVEELVQVLGLPNDACRYRPSLFCEDDLVDEMTAADRILLATLYDKRLAAGMSRVDAMPVIREVISEHYANASG